MAQNLQKRPSKGILKSRSVDTQDEAASTSKRPKEQRFDEMNIMETFHPADKDYGHMKVNEPDTPYSEPVDGNFDPNDQVDANLLAAKLAASMNRPPKVLESSSDEEEDEEERKRREEFEQKRKMHYNEFQALQLARKLMEQDERDTDDDSEGEQDKRAKRK